MNRIEYPSSISMATGLRIDLSKKICMFLMARDPAALLSLPGDQLHAVYDAVVPAKARTVSWQPWMET